MTHAYDEQEWAKIFKNEENLRDECVALLRAAASEQEFLNIFEARSSDLCFSSGSLFFDQALDVLVHAVERNWLTGARAMLKWIECTQPRDGRLWSLAISKASTTAMVDVFFERPHFPHSDQCVERFAKSSTPSLFLHCLNQVKSRQKDFQMESVVVKLARQGLVDQLDVLNDDDLCEIQWGKVLYAACRHDQFGMIDFLYTPERARLAMEEEKKFNFILTATGRALPNQGDGWMYLQAKMDRKMIKSAVGDGEGATVGRALKI